jgi:hypothetical protein
MREISGYFLLRSSAKNDYFNLKVEKVKQISIL